MSNESRPAARAIVPFRARSRAVPRQSFVLSRRREFGFGGCVWKKREDGREEGHYARASGRAAWSGRAARRAATTQSFGPAADFYRAT